MNVKARDEHMTRLTKEAQEKVEGFALAEATVCDGFDRWLLREKMDWLEVCALRSGRLAVGGPLFGRHGHIVVSCDQGDIPTITLKQLALRADTEWCGELAADDIADYCDGHFYGDEDDEDDDGEARPIDPDLKVLLLGLAKECRDGSVDNEDMMQDAKFLGLPRDDYLDWGLRPTIGLINAWATIRRLASLLEATK